MSKNRCRMSEKTASDFHLSVYTEAYRSNQRLLFFLSLSLCSLSLREGLPFFSSLLFVDSLPPDLCRPLSSFFLSLPLSDGLLFRLPPSLLRLLLLDDEDDEDEDDDEDRLEPDDEDELPLEDDPDEEEEELLLRLRRFLTSFPFFLPLPWSSSFFAGAVATASLDSGSFCGTSSSGFLSTAWFSTVGSWTLDSGAI